MGKIVLCADVESLIHPLLLGLEDVNLEKYEWLVTLSGAAEARAYLAKHGDTDEVWIVSSDEVEAINLAAAVLKDTPTLSVYLISPKTSGSELSRATQAKVRAVLAIPAFCERFALEARRRALVQEVAGVGVDEMLDDALDGAFGDALGVARGDAPDGARGDAPDVARGATSNGGPGVAQSTPPSVGSDGAQGAAGALSRGVHGAAGESPRGAHGAAHLAPSEAAHRPFAHEKAAFVVSFVSGSGGVGKSTAASVAAYRCAMRGLRTVALDCDLQFGDLCQMMGATGAPTIDDILSAPETIDHLAQATPPGAPALVSAPSRLERSEDLGAHLAEVLGICSSAFDVVLVNTGANWSESHAQLLERSAASIFLIDQRASSVHACRHALDLCMRLGIASGSFLYALNRCRRGALFTSIDIANVMQGAHVFELKDGGGEVEELLGAGLASELASTRNEFCVSVDEMLDDVLPAPAQFAQAPAAFTRTQAHREGMPELARLRKGTASRSGASAGAGVKAPRRKKARAAR